MAVSAGGLGGAGVSNGGTIVTLSSSGKILGGTGGAAHSGAGGAGGAGVSNSGTMFALTNSGLIEGGKGGTGPKGSGAQGDAIDSAGAHASIGSIANTGRIVGNVVIDDQVSVTVTGGSGKTFGRWTGGAITIGAGSLTFASGNTALGDDISVDVTVTGGTRKSFGSWTGGAITIGNGNVTFASGNTALGDDIFVNGGDGTVTNMGALRADGA